MIGCIRRQSLTMVLASCALLCGCTVGQNAHRTLILEPGEYFWKSDRQRSLELYARWAEQAWAVERHHLPKPAASVEYGRGFRDGFVDYVDAGGSGEPPPVPPRRFWNVERRAAAGRSAAQDWFAGYRHGAGAARDGGYRRQAVLPSSLWRTEKHDLPPGYLVLEPWGPIDQTIDELDRYEVLPEPASPDEQGDRPLLPPLERPDLSAAPRPVSDPPDAAPETISLAAATVVGAPRRDRRGGRTRLEPAAPSAPPWTERRQSPSTLRVLGSRQASRPPSAADAAAGRPAPGSAQRPAAGGKGSIRILRGDVSEPALDGGR